MEQAIIGFYVGCGTTAAIAICIGIWWQSRVDRAMDDSYNEGMHDAYTQVAAQGAEMPRTRPIFVTDSN